MLPGGCWFTSLTIFAKKNLIKFITYSISKLQFIKTHFSFVNLRKKVSKTNCPLFFNHHGKHYLFSVPLDFYLVYKWYRIFCCMSWSNKMLFRSRIKRLKMNLCTYSNASGIEGKMQNIGKGCNSRNWATVKPLNRQNGVYNDFPTALGKTR